MQLRDKIRLDATRSFYSGNTVTINAVFIKPSDDNGFFNVTGTLPIRNNNWYLDWAYDTPGVKTVTLRVLGSDSVHYEVTRSVTVLTEAQDRLFAKDEDLLSFDSEILSYIPEGRSSFNHIHRRVQAEILDFLDRLRVRNPDGSKITKEQLNITHDIKELATYWALMLIYFDLSNKNDDKFFQKYQECRTKVEALKSKGSFDIDLNSDGDVSPSERWDIKSARIDRG